MDSGFIRSVAIRWDDVRDRTRYPFSIPAVRTLKTLQLDPRVTFFVGENGTGKSTLLEAIAVAWGFNPEGGSRNFNFQTTTEDSTSRLATYVRLTKGVKRPKTGYFLRAESFFNVVSEIERLDADPGAGPRIGPAYGDRPLHAVSHGESFVSLLQHRFRANGLYLLDEPEAALSPRRQIEVLGTLHNLVSRGAQFIIATHSPILTAYPGRIYQFSADGMEPVDYEEAEVYTWMRDFIRAPQRFLTRMLDDAEFGGGDDE